MNDLLDQLGRLAGPAPEADDATVAADLRRGRVALRRRRLARSATSGIAALAVAGVATAVVVGGNSGSSTPTASNRSTAPTIRLADYDGTQLPGFEVTKVPTGFVLQGANAYTLDIARPDDQSSVDSFAGKLVVMLLSKDAPFDTSGQQVDVNGHPGYLRHDDGTAILEYSDGTHDVVVQSWSGIGLTDQQVVEFADGVTVTDAAVAGVG